MGSEAAKFIHALRRRGALGYRFGTRLRTRLGATQREAKFGGLFGGARLTPERHWA